MQIDHDPQNRYPNDRKNLWLAIAFVIFAVIMGGLSWLLDYMDIQFAAGFVTGFLLAAGCLGVALKEVRNLS